MADQPRTQKQVAQKYKDNLDYYRHGHFPAAHEARPFPARNFRQPLRALRISVLGQQGIFQHGTDLAEPRTASPTIAASATRTLKQT
jgi:hypothetical protein